MQQGQNDFSNDQTEAGEGESTKIDPHLGSVEEQQRLEFQRLVEEHHGCVEVCGIDHCRRCRQQQVEG